MDREERNRFLERRGAGVLAGLVVVLIVFGMAMARDAKKTPPPEPWTCQAWVVDVESAQAGDYTPVPITKAGRPIGTVLVCDGARGETQAMVRISHGQQHTDIPLTLQQVAGYNAMAATGSVGIPEPDMWELEYSIEGRTVAKTWVRVDE